MICRLCKEDKPLRKSHIFSEWLYESLYDEKHRFFILSTDSAKRRGTRPTGIYDKLLCDTCEGRFAEWEGYTRSFFHNTSQKSMENSRKIVFFGAEYARFKLFQMSLLWRASVTSRPEIHAIDLGPHSEHIRQMLFEERPGEPHQYGSILMLPAFEQELMEHFIYPPEKVPAKVDGHTAYRAVFVGLFWLFIVSNHSEHLPQEELFLSKQGRLPVFKVGEPALRFMQRLAVDFSAAGMLRDLV